MRIASALFSVMASLILLQYSVSDDMALLPIAEYEQFWGLQSQLMLPFAIQGNPMDLSFDSLQEPSIVAKAYMEKLSTLRGNISRSVSLMGCPDEFCSEATLSSMIRRQQDIFWGRDDPLLLKIGRNRPLDTLMQDLLWVCMDSLRLNEVMCKQFENFVLQSMTNHARLCRQRSNYHSATTAQPRRLLVTSVPRSGNGWVRKILNSLGVAFQASVECGFEYRAKDQFIRMEKQRRETLGEDETLNSIAKNSPSWENDVKYFIAKSHYPFDSAGNCGCRETISPGNESASCVIQLVRNPFDNHDAWLRYLRKENSLRDLWTPCLSFVRFMNQWAFFHEYWSELANQSLGTRGGRHVVLRYEDLLDNPARAIAGALKSCDVKVGEVDAKSARQELTTLLHDLIFSESNGLQPHNAVKIGNSFQLYSREEVEWVLGQHRELMDRFNYTSLLERQALNQSKALSNRSRSSIVSSRSGRNMKQLRKELLKDDFMLFFLTNYLPGHFLHVYTQGTWTTISGT